MKATQLIHRDIDLPIVDLFTLHRCLRNWPAITLFCFFFTSVGGTPNAHAQAHAHVHNFYLQSIL